MKNLSDAALVAELRSLVRREREVVTEVLRYLREVEARRVFVARGFSSLFAFCTGELGYSEPEAMLRIQSMRLLRVAPEVAQLVEKGELSMSVAAQIQSASRREGLEKDETRELVRELKGSSKREAEKKLAARFPEAPKPERRREVAEDLVEIRFTVTRKEAEEFEKLLDRKAHTNFKRSYEKLFVALAQKELARMEKPEESPAKDTPPQCPGKVKSRHIPAKTRRQIFSRDQGRCQFQDPLTKRSCNSRHGLQLDHIKPYAEGGNHSPENLRLLCGAHNRWRSDAG
jgi:hypothetical protein